MIFDGDGQAFPKFPKKFAMSLQCLKKEVRDEVFFFECRESPKFPLSYNTLGIKVSYKVILSLLMGIVLKVLKVKSLQYL